MTLPLWGRWRYPEKSKGLTLLQWENLQPRDDQNCLLKPPQRDEPELIARLKAEER